MGNPALRKTTTIQPDNGNDPEITAAARKAEFAKLDDGGDPPVERATSDIDKPITDDISGMITPAVPSAEVDHFANLAALRLSQAFLETGGGVKKLLTSVPIRKPNQQDYNRVDPDPDHRLAGVALVKLRDDRDEIYLLTPSVAAAMPGEFTLATIFTAINRQQVVFLWPVFARDHDDGRERPNEWRRTSAQAAELAMGKWIRMKANMSLGAYDIYEAPATIPDPVWPEYSFEDLLRIGFRGRIVDSLDHPLVQQLRGLI
jgi:hypothetical protein